MAYANGISCNCFSSAIISWCNGVKIECAYSMCRIVIPLGALATVSAGPAPKAVNKNHTVVNGAVIKLNKEKVERIINYCIEEKSSAEILELLDMKSKDYFRKNILNPMIEAGLLKLTIPDKPKSPDQKYIKA